MPPKMKSVTRYPRRPVKPVNLDTQVYEMLTEMAGYADRAIKSHLERVVRQEYRRFKRRNKS